MFAGQRIQLEKQSSNVTLHSSVLNRHELHKSAAKFPSCTSCELDLCPSHSNLHHLSPSYINKQLNLMQQNSNPPKTNPNILSQNAQQSHNLLLKDYSMLQQKRSVPTLEGNLFHGGRQMFVTKKVLPNRASYSQESLDLLQENHDHFYHRNSDMGLNMLVNNNVVKNSRNLARLNRMRLSRSEDSLNDLEVRELSKYYFISIFYNVFYFLHF